MGEIEALVDTFDKEDTFKDGDDEDWTEDKAYKN